jgi:hypothetical protein
MNTRSLSIAGTMALALLGCRREPTGPTAEIPLGAEFTVQTAGWATRAPVPFVVRALAVAVARDSIYIMGGAAGSGLGSFVSSGVRAYSPTTNAWEWRLGLPAGRQGGDGAATINGIIYLPGGEGSASLPTRSLYAYNTGTQAWSTRAPMPTYGACGGSAVISGQLYVFSGCTRSSTNTEIDARLLHRYNPTTNTWKTLQPASVTHFRPVVATYGGKLYVNAHSSSERRRSLPRRQVVCRWWPKWDGLPEYCGSLRPGHQHLEQPAPHAHTTGRLGSGGCERGDLCHGRS